MIGSLLGRFCHLRRLRNRWFLHGQGGVWKTKVDRHAYCTLEAKCYINRMGSLDLNIRPVFCLFLLVLFAFSLLKKRQKATHILSLKFSFFYLITMPICSRLSASWEGSATAACFIIVGSCTGTKKQDKQAVRTSIHSSGCFIMVLFAVCLTKRESQIPTSPGQKRFLLFDVHIHIDLP